MAGLFDPPDPNNPFATEQPSMAEILFKLASVMGPLAPFIGGTRTPMGRMLGAGSALAGGVGGTFADLMAAQRKKSPLEQQMFLHQLAGQAAQGVTVPVPGKPETSIPLSPLAAGDFGDRPEGADPLMLTTQGTPATTRRPQSDAELLANISDPYKRAAVSMVGAKQFVDEPKYAISENRVIQTNAPGGPQITSTLPETPMNAAQLEHVREQTAALKQSGAQKQAADDAEKRLAAAAAADMAATGSKDMLGSISKVVNTPEGVMLYGGLTGSSPLLKAAIEDRKQRDQNALELTKEKFRMQLEARRNADRDARDAARLANKFNPNDWLRYNPETNSMETAPGDTQTTAELKAMGFREVRDLKSRERLLSGNLGLDLQYQKLQAAADVYKSTSAISLKLGQVTSGWLGSEAGASVAGVGRQYVQFLEKEFGGARAASSKPLIDAATSTLTPTITDQPNVIDTKMAALKIINDGLKDAPKRAFAGLGPDPKLVAQVNEYVEEVKRLSGSRDNGPPKTPGTPTRMIYDENGNLVQSQ